MNRYEKWAEFKQVLIKRLGKDLPDELWVLIEDILFSSAIHEPFDDGDIEFSLKRIRKVLRAWRKEGK